MLLSDMIGREAERSLDRSKLARYRVLLRRASTISLVVEQFGLPTVLALFPENGSSR